MNELNKLEQLLDYNELSYILGDLMTFGVFSIEDLSKLTSEDIDKLEIGKDSEDYRKLNKIIKQISSRYRCTVNEVHKEQQPSIEKNRNSINSKETIENISNKTTSVSALEIQKIIAIGCFVVATIILMIGININGFNLEYLIPYIIGFITLISTGLYLLNKELLLKKSNLAKALMSIGFFILILGIIYSGTRGRSLSDFELRYIDPSYFIFEIIFFIVCLVVGIYMIKTDGSLDRDKEKTPHDKNDIVHWDSNIYFVTFKYAFIRSYFIAPLSLIVNIFTLYLGWEAGYFFIFSCIIFIILEILETAGLFRFLKISFVACIINSVLSIISSILTIILLQFFFVLSFGLFICHIVLIILYSCQISYFRKRKSFYDK